MSSAKVETSKDDDELETYFRSLNNSVSQKKITEPPQLPGSQKYMKTASTRNSNQSSIIDRSKILLQKIKEDHKSKTLNQENDFDDTEIAGSTNHDYDLSSSPEPSYRYNVEKTVDSKQEYDDDFEKDSTSTEYESVIGDSILSNVKTIKDLEFTAKDIKGSEGNRNSTFTTSNSFNQNENIKEIGSYPDKARDNNVKFENTNSSIKTIEPDTNIERNKKISKNIGDDENQPSAIIVNNDHNRERTISNIHDEILNSRSNDTGSSLDKDFVSREIQCDLLMAAHTPHTASIDTILTMSQKKIEYNLQSSDILLLSRNIGTRASDNSYRIHRSIFSSRLNQWTSQLLSQRK
ncbi:hypothetical protein ROZALSC1DRAFT_21800 [Rozella allomycis CSF55]|uniref:Uncharacterized protein n=1 Tax=Rozella allomycis (strain CSF55) TaxID=988480 RepID=A0A4P9YK52_ROZAC|nr:hypothetical protein ROZALSC1DRAFT_21800 [Rozella allomycis CSF55]